MAGTLGLYLSIPFCKAKCSFCNFASGVFAAERMQGYVDRLCLEIRQARAWAHLHEADLPHRLDTIYFGGGTPSLLEPHLLTQIVTAIHAEFQVAAETEFTVECAPGQMTDETLHELQLGGMNRVSLGVQSFVDRESAAVGRLHTASECHAEVLRLRASGVERLALDLIVGLPHQTEASWKHTIDEALATGVEHVSVYMLEVDEESRLGREVLAGGGRYGAAALPSEDCVADWFAASCEWLAVDGMPQYEISNFARPEAHSRHNTKYWRREPYLGFGLDAHSMLNAGNGALRWANPDEMQAYMGEGLLQVQGEEANRAGRRAEAGHPRTIERIGSRAAFEETLFLGLRMVEGVDLVALRSRFGEALLGEIALALGEVESAGLLMREGTRLRLTRSGQMISNEVFSRLLVGVAA